MLEYSFPDYDKLTLIGLADLHIGSPQFSEKKLMRFLDKWGSQENVRFIIAGDVIDNGLKDSKTECMEATYNPDKQIDTAIKLLTPIKDKILIYRDGNHEKRTANATSMRVGKIISSELGIKDKFSHEATGYLKLSVGKRKNGWVKSPVYSVAVHHGSSKAKKKKHTIAVGCDVIMSGHDHMPELFPLESFDINIRDGIVTLKRTHVVNLTAWLGYGGYGEDAMYQPCSIAPNWVNFYGGEHYIETVGT